MTWFGRVGYESVEENVDVTGDGGPFVEIDEWHKVDGPSLATFYLVCYLHYTVYGI